MQRARVRKPLWSDEEIAQLEHLMEEAPYDWSYIATKLNRNVPQVQMKWSRMYGTLTEIYRMQGELKPGEDVELDAILPLDPNDPLEDIDWSRFDFSE
jgi:hypothetical protein